MKIRASLSDYATVRLTDRGRRVWNEFSPISSSVPTATDELNVPLWALMRAFGPRLGPGYASLIEASEIELEGPSPANLVSSLPSPLPPRPLPLFSPAELADFRLRAFRELDGWGTTRRVTDATAPEFTPWDFTARMRNADRLLEWMTSPPLVC